jgi:hypothetical protein
MKSIIIIIPYFGSFPKQFKFWLQSAYNNPTIDFLLITDQELVVRDNVKVVNMNFDEIKLLYQSKFDFPINIASPYKLCDFRVTHGYVFSKFVEDYEFWGFGDIDLVYGDIRHFFTDTILSSYKVLSGFGHLTLYNNCEMCNSFFTKKVDGFKYYKDAFNYPKITLFEEYLHGGMSDLWKHLHPDLVYDQKPFDDILVPRLAFNFISVFNPTVSKNLIFEYYNGNLYRIFTNDKNEIIKEPTLYAHFQQRKFMKVETNNLKHYLIVPNSFIDYSTVTLAKIIRWSKPQILNRTYWNFKNRAIRRSKIILSKFKTK